MKQAIYLETSVISYLTARSNRDIVVQAHQSITQKWWKRRRGEYEMYVSELVISEATKGDSDAAGKRLDVIRDFALLEAIAPVKELARMYIKAMQLPGKAAEDAVHMALASFHAMDYLVTWNCKHIANEEVRENLRFLNSSQGILTPKICTPEEMLWVKSGKTRL